MNNLLIHGPIKAILALKNFSTSANDLDDAIPFLLSLVDESIEELKILGAACLIKILRYFTPDVSENCLTLTEQDKDDSKLVETLRPSLMVLLPIIKTKSAIFDFPLVVGRLTCLNVLLKGSWPIIEKHGGNVMSALLICVEKTKG